MTVLFQPTAERGEPVYPYRGSEPVAHLPKDYPKDDFGYRFAIRGHGWFHIKTKGEGKEKHLRLDRPLPEGLSL